MTFILDISPEEGLARAGKRLEEDQSGEDRFEQLDIEFHKRLRQGYLDIAAQEPERCKVVDAVQSAEAMADEIFEIVKQTYV